MGIDVIVCAKNREKPMANVLKQITREIPVENLIVIYGTSSDRTREIALQYTEKVYWDEDKGLGAARNLGIRKSSSEIVAMIDADVILTRSWYQKLFRHFTDDKVAAAMGTCIYGYGCPPLQEYWEQRAQGQEGWGCHNVMFRRNTILNIGNFDERIKGAGEDYDVYNRLREAGFRWVWDKEVVVYHPMNLLEHLKHYMWWAKGVTSLNEEKPFTLPQLLSNLALTIRRNVTYVTLHPILAAYVPLIEVLWLMTDFKTRCSRQRKTVLEEAKRNQPISIYRTF